jgi:hypothetical protein
MTDIAARTGAGPRAEIVALQVLIGVFLALRLYYQLNGDLLGDEAYYWMWGQHLSWSYFDHPPLHAWLMRVMATLFGWHVFSVRLLTWVTLAVVFAILWAWSKRFAPAEPVLWFWRAAAIYLASPIFFGMTASAYNDHLLVAMALLAIHCFLVFLERAEERKPRATRWLYFAAIALGLATLTKYNGVFVGLGFGLTFLLRPKLRALLRTPHPWLAALVAIAMQTPVLWWNLAAGGASFRYHFDDRWGRDVGGIQWDNALAFAGVSVLLWSPFLIAPAVAFIRSIPAPGFADRARTLVVSIFAVSTVTLLAMSFVFNAYFYWNIVGLAGLTAVLAVTLTGRWLLWSHLAYGLAAAALVVCNFSVAPIGSILNFRDDGTSINFDWDVVAKRVLAAESKAPTDLIGATRYSTTSQLGFKLGTTAVVKLSPEHSQYDYWPETMPLAGQSATILVDEGDQSGVIRYLRRHFETLDQVDSFSIRRMGRPIYRWRILRGDNWIP